MHYKLGLVCSMKNKHYTTNKSFRLKSLTKEKLFETVMINLEGLEKIAGYCKSNKISTLRLGNSIVPFASHPNFDQSWLNELESLFTQTREKLKNYPLRLTIHPGQFIQLGSKNPKVLESSLAELRYCTKVLDLLADQKDGVICLHIGGRAGDANATIERFYEVFMQNTWLEKYLALENDENNFNAKETLFVCKRCKIPMIFDIFHHSLNPSEIQWSEIKSSWKHKRPKIHISSQGDGPTGMHAPYIQKKDFQTLKEFVGDDIDKIDIMIEAKAKEEAIKRVFSY